MLDEWLLESVYVAAQPAATIVLPDYFQSGGFGLRPVWNIRIGEGAWIDTVLG